MSWKIKAEGEALYIKEINQFLGSEVAFNRFKSASIYTMIIGQPVLHQAVMMINKLPPKMKEMLPTFRKADTIGSPPLFKFKEVDEISLNLCRHLDTLRLLEENFGSLDGYNLLEVGGGWGGLAYVVNTYFKPHSYHIVDLEPAMALAKKHSDLLKVDVRTGNSPFDIDLAIAEYSITEHDGESLTDLTLNYLMKADRIFVRCNLQDEVQRENWLMGLRTKFKITVSDEVGNPISYNKVIVGQPHDI